MPNPENNRKLNRDYELPSPNALVDPQTAEALFHMNLFINSQEKLAGRTLNQAELLKRAKFSIEYLKPEQMLSHGRIELDTKEGLLRISSSPVPIPLTTIEFSLVRILIEAKGDLLRKERIVDKLSEVFPNFTDSALKTHISRIRNKARAIGIEDGDIGIAVVPGYGLRVLDFDERIKRASVLAPEQYPQPQIPAA